jgi:DNA-binding NtrC family response regulator
LYYRLNVIAINLPSLRERPEDIPLLVAHFMKDKLNPRNGQPIGITRKTMAVLAAHDWPGNVRELENALERAGTLCEDNVIRVADLPPSLPMQAGEGIAEPPGSGDLAEPRAGAVGRGQGKGRAPSRHQPGHAVSQAR